MSFFKTRVRAKIEIVIILFHSIERILQKVAKKMRKAKHGHLKMRIMLYGARTPILDIARTLFI